MPTYTVTRDVTRPNTSTEWPGPNLSTNGYADLVSSEKVTISYSYDSDDLVQTSSFVWASKTDYKNKTVAVSGFGNVAWGVCKKVRDLGGKVVTLSGPGGYIYDPDGVTTQDKIDFMIKMRTNPNGKIEDYAKKFNVEFFPGKKPWEQKVDIVMPCATQNEIHPQDAENIIKNGVKYIIEGANMPTTNEAVQVLQKAGIIIGPGKAANAGGVATSALEMSQNSMRIAWTAEEVDLKLREIMKNIFNSCVRSSARYGFGYDLIAGANIAGFTKVADAMISQGIY